MKEQTFASVLLSTSLVGLIVWALVPGLFHAYVASVDWAEWSPSEETLPQLFQGRAFVALLVFGIVLGFSAQAAALVGGAAGSQGIALFGPMLAGILVGGLQGYLIGTDLWGFTTANIPLRAETTRVLAGGICGFVAVPPVMMISVYFRNRQRFRR